MENVRHIPQFRSSINALPVFNMPYNKASYDDIFSRIGALLSFSVKYLEDLISQNLADPATVESVIREAERAYDIYIGPIDLPWVPNLIEPLVDAQLRAAIRPNLQAAADYFRNRKAPAPAPTPAPAPATPPPGAAPAAAPAGAAE